MRSGTWSAQHTSGSAPDLETYGHDLPLVRSYPIGCVWSGLDCCEVPDQSIVPGIHFVNRVCYMLTELPHDWTDVQFRVHNDLRALMVIGLKRRLRKLRKTLLIQSADSKKQVDAA